MTPSSAKPAADEFELTLLGRGVGESCVVHLGSGRWIIVDSFNEPGHRPDGAAVPAARVYLDGLGVEPEAVEALVVTHFHADHIGGIDALHDYYTQARLFVPSALSEKTFRRLYDPQVDPATAALAATITRAARRPFGSHHWGLDWLGAATFVIRSGSHHGDIEVLSLAPSAQAVNIAAIELRRAMELDPRRVALKRHLADENRTSSALHIRACGVTAMLGGDVIANPGEFGWPAIHEDPRHQDLAPADIVKLAHHGSQGADYPPLWGDLIADQAPLLVAPYWPSGIPDPAFAQELAMRAPLYQAAPSTPDVTDAYGYTTKLVPQTGVVQARKTASGPWQIGLGGPASLLADP